MHAQHSHTTHSLTELSHTLTTTQHQLDAERAATAQLTAQLHSAQQSAHAATVQATVQSERCAEYERQLQELRTVTQRLQVCVCGALYRSLSLIC